METFSTEDKAKVEKNIIETLDKKDDDLKDSKEGKDEIAYAGQTLDALKDIRKVLNPDAETDTEPDTTSENPAEKIDKESRRKAVDDSINEVVNNFRKEHPDTELNSTIVYLWINQTYIAPHLDNIGKGLSYEEHNSRYKESAKDINAFLAGTGLLEKESDTYDAATEEATNQWQEFLNPKVNKLIKMVESEEIVLSEEDKGKFDQLKDIRNTSKNPDGTPDGAFGPLTKVASYLVLKYIDELTTPVKVEEKEEEPEEVKLAELLTESSETLPYGAEYRVVVRKDTPIDSNGKLLKEGTVVYYRIVDEVDEPIEVRVEGESEWTKSHINTNYTLPAGLFGKRSLASKEFRKKAKEKWKKYKKDPDWKARSKAGDDLMEEIREHIFNSKGAEGSDNWPPKDLVKKLIAINYGYVENLDIKHKDEVKIKDGEGSPSEVKNRPAKKVNPSQKDHLGEARSPYSPSSSDKSREKIDESKDFSEYKEVAPGTAIKHNMIFDEPKMIEAKDMRAGESGDSEGRLPGDPRFIDKNLSTKISFPSSDKFQIYSYEKAGENAVASTKTIDFKSALKGHEVQSLSIDGNAGTEESGATLDLTYNLSTEESEEKAELKFQIQVDQNGKVTIKQGDKEITEKPKTETKTEEKVEPVTKETGKEVAEESEESTEETTEEAKATKATDRKTATKEAEATKSDPPKTTITITPTTTPPDTTTTHAGSTTTTTTTTSGTTTTTSTG